jgi:hypothetical protein
MWREAIFILLSHVQTNAAWIHLLNERIAVNGASVNERRQELFKQPKQSALRLIERAEKPGT